MADIKISELQPTTDLEGLYTIGSDKNNLSKKVSLQFLREAADYAIEQGDYAKQEGSTIESRITDFKAETDAKLTELESKTDELNPLFAQYSKYICGIEVDFDFSSITLNQITLSVNGKYVVLSAVLPDSTTLTFQFASGSTDNEILSSSEQGNTVRIMVKYYGRLVDESGLNVPCNRTGVTRTNCNDGIVSSLKKDIDLLKPSVEELKSQVDGGIVQVVFDATGFYYKTQQQYDYVIDSPDFKRTTYFVKCEDVLDVHILQYTDMYYVLYDIDKNAIGAYDGTNLLTTQEFKSKVEEVNAVYARFSIRTTDDGYVSISANGIVADIKSLDKRVSLLEGTEPKWKGKIISCIGDSIVEGKATGGGWVKYLKELTGASYIQNAGISGSTVAGLTGKAQAVEWTDGYFPMWGRVESQNIDDWVWDKSNPTSKEGKESAYILPNSNLIIISGGVNDYGISIPLGEYGNFSSNGNFYGALNTLFEKLKATYPNAKIVYVTPMQCNQYIKPENPDSWYNSNAENYHHTKMYMYIEAIYKMCELHSIELLDMYGSSGMSPFNDRDCYLYADGLHPNDWGYKSMVKKISSFINSL